MSEKLKYISDNPQQRSMDFLKIYDHLDLKNLEGILDKQPNLINKRDEITGMTLLFHAIANGNFEKAEYLLEKRNANPNVQNIYGETALHHAVENSNHKMINLLLENGSDPNIQQQEGETAMHIAALLGDYKVIKLLHLYGGDPKIATFSTSYTALDYALQRNNQKCTEVIQSILLKEGCISNKRDGFQTSKHSESPMHRIRSQIEMQPFKAINFPETKLVNMNTSKHTRNPSNFILSNDPRNLPLAERNIRPLRKERFNSYNFGPSQLSEISYTNSSGMQNNNNLYFDANTAVGYDHHHNYRSINSPTEPSFINQMNDFEQRLEKIKKDLFENVQANEDRKMTRSGKEFADNKIEKSPSQPSTININSDGLIINNKKSQFSHTKSNSNSFNVFKEKVPKCTNKINHAKKYGYSSASLPDFLNYDSLITTHNQKKQQSSLNSQRREESVNNEIEKPECDQIFNNINNNDDATFTFNIDDNRMITLKPEEECEGQVDFVDEINTTRISYKNQPTEEIFIPRIADSSVYDMPLNRNMKKPSECSNYSGVKINSNFFENVEKNTRFNKKIAESFIDQNRPLAVFSSRKNDISELVRECQLKSNDMLRKSSHFKEDGENTKKRYEELFNFNFEELNEFILQTEDKKSLEESLEDDEYLEEFIDQEQKVLSKNFTGTFNLPMKEIDQQNKENASNVKYFSKSNRSIKDEFKQISLDTQTIDGNSKKVENMENKNTATTRPTSNPLNISMTDYESKEVKEITNFLSKICMEEYTSLFIKNGFDDLKILIEQMKMESSISDKNLKDIGVSLAGHRAKILIKLEEESNSFEFNVPSNVYFIPREENNTSLPNEPNSCQFALQSWLSKIRMDSFIKNFLQAGYHSIDLLMVQMLSKNPVTEQILEEDIGIDKIGHRIRFLNKLKDDSKLYAAKMKSKVKLTESKEYQSCKCLIF